METFRASNDLFQIYLQIDNQKDTEKRYHQYIYILECKDRQKTKITSNFWHLDEANKAVEV